MSNNHATGLKRLSRIFFMKMANSLPLSGKRRTKLMRLGGGEYWRTKFDI